MAPLTGAMADGKPDLLDELVSVADEHADLAGRAYLRIRQLTDTADRLFAAAMAVAEDYPPLSGDSPIPRYQHIAALQRIVGRR